MIIIGTCISVSSGKNEGGIPFDPILKDADGSPLKDYDNTDLKDVDK